MKPMDFEEFLWANNINETTVDILNNKGEVYSRIIISSPLINSMDMLGLNYTQPIASSETFRVEFKYSNIDYQFIQMKEEKL